MVTPVSNDIENLIASIYTMQDIHQFIYLTLQRFHTLTLYVIEPYIPQNEGEALRIPVSENYSIYDYGGRIVVTPNDVYAVSLFACGEFLLAVEEALQIILQAEAKEIAILGDHRAKLFVWDRCDRLNTIENNPVKLINFGPPEAFGLTREAVLRWMRAHGMEPKTRPTPKL
jgi:hypothetical protein